MPGEGVRVPLVDLAPQHRETREAMDAAWHRVAASGRYVGGPEVERFEHAWAAFCGSTGAVGVANGTDAIFLTLRALGVGEGDEVVVPANTFIATAEAVVACGATPHFADVDPASLVVNADTLARAITPRTAAIIVVHLYGHTPDMDAVLTLADRHRLPVIEDAAQAHGATYRGRRVGSFGTAACFSFYPTKNLGALGDGGAVVSDDSQLLARIREIADHGRSATDRDGHVAFGVNSRLDALQAAMLSVKLEHLDGWTRARRDVADRYRQVLGDIDVQLVVPTEGCESAYHLFVVRTHDRDGVRASLARQGIETGVHYPVPCHRQPPYAKWSNGDLSVCEQAADEILSLPFFPHMTDEQVTEVGQALAEATAATAGTR